MFSLVFTLDTLSLLLVGFAGVDGGGVANSSVRAQELGDVRGRRLGGVRREIDAVAGGVRVEQGSHRCGPVRVRVAPRPLAAADGGPRERRVVPGVVARFDVRAA